MLKTTPTKARIVDAALPLIARHGFAGASVRKVCAAVGIRESSFYAHFRNKDDLLQVLIGRAGSEEPLRILEELAGQGLSIEAFVSSLLERLLHAWTDADARRLRVVLELEAARSARFRARFNAGVGRFFERLAVALAAYQRSGALSSDHDPAALGWNLVAPVASLRSTLLAEGTTPSDRRLAAAIVAGQRALWLAAFAVPGTKGRS